MNLMTLLEMAADAQTNRVAVGSRHDGFTYRQLHEAAGAAAARFRSAQASHVVLCDESSPAVPIALFGAAWAGVPYVPLNYRLADSDLRRLAARTAPAMAIGDVASIARLDGIAGIDVMDRIRFLDLVQEPLKTAPEPPSSTDPDLIAVLLFTSGTTGEPKSAVLRHRHLVSYILGSVEFMGAGLDEATIVSVPPYHIAGVAAVLSSLYAGRRIVQLPSFDPFNWIDTVKCEGITHAMVVPTMMARIVEALEARGGTEMLAPETLSYGGGRMPLPVIRRALELFPITNFVNAYGLTETSSTIALLGPDDHRAAQYGDDPDSQRRLTSVGRALPAVEVAIRDSSGRDLPAGTPGEIYVRGEQIAGEYTEEGSLLVDGWFGTRDGGWVDTGGYLFVTGRSDDVIIRGGENMSPGEIENVVLEHPGVRDAAAIGVPSNQWGEQVVLVVVAAAVTAENSELSTVTYSESRKVMSGGPDSTFDGLSDALRELVRGQLRSSRVPAHVVFVDALPYSETGKLLRRVLREQFASLGDDG